MLASYKFKLQFNNLESFKLYVDMYTYAIFCYYCRTRKTGDCVNRLLFATVTPNINI